MAHVGPLEQQDECVDEDDGEHKNVKGLYLAFVLVGRTLRPLFLLQDLIIPFQIELVFCVYHRKDETATLVLRFRV